jgi:amino acid transporter
VRSENLVWTSTPAAADVARTSLLLIFAFAGVECALVPSGEVRNPSRTVPRAIAVAMIGITALYLSLQVSAQGILGAALATSTAAPLADAANASFGPWARALLLVGAAVSCSAISAAWRSRYRACSTRLPATAFCHRPLRR